LALDYHFSFAAPATASADDLESFLQDVEQYAQTLGGGAYVANDKLKGTALASKQDANHHNQASGSCRLVPRKGVVLVVTDERGQRDLLRVPEVSGHHL
jgi:hypothetical protein